MQLRVPYLCSGSTPLHIAAYQGDVRMCLVLLDTQWRQPGVELRRLRNARGLVSSRGWPADILLPGQSFACLNQVRNCSRHVHEERTQAGGLPGHAGAAERAGAVAGLLLSSAAGNGTARVAGRAVCRW